LLVSTYDLINCYFIAQKKPSLGARPENSDRSCGRLCCRENHPLWKYLQANGLWP